MWALFEMMDVASADQDELARLTTAAFDDSDESTAAARARAAAHAAIFGYFAELVRLRRAHPGTDMVTSLTQAEVNGRKLSDEEVILNCDGLLNGGLETTPHALSGAILAFAQDPGAWRRLREDPLLIDPAVEEIIRWTSPAMQAVRTATTDISIGPAAIRRGERVAVWLPSCNRDETVFGDADVFRIDRNPNPHLGFGAGPHMCIAAGLARLELRCFLTAMTRLVASIELDGAPIRQTSSFLNGLTRLNVRLVPMPGL
jgi:cytochrome P450